MSATPIHPTRSAAIDPTHASAVDLAAAIRAGEVTSTAVVEAHIAVLERIVGTHALAADRFDLARAEAAAADARVAEFRVAGGGRELPPLHGVPMTAKEMLAVAGMPHTGGWVHRKRLRETADATVVARMRRAGAIVLGIGNTCGMFVWIESNHPLYGRVDNAYDSRRTAGGSSGGDGVMVGSGGTPIALGSDLGGSIRIPAFFNGVFGHLPSPGLVPLTGHFPMPEGALRARLSPGPLTRRAADLMPVLRMIAGPDGEDPNTWQQPLGDPDDVSIDGLPVLVVTHAATVPQRPQLHRALEDSARALEARGAVIHEASAGRLRWALPEIAAVAAAEIDLLASWRTITAPTGVRDLPGVITAVPAAALRLVESAPVRMVRSLAGRRLVSAARRAQDTLADLVGGGVLLYPPFPRFAPLHRHTLGQPWLATNTAVFNLYGMPATQVPLGLASNGLPLGVQVAATPGADHLTIATALALEEDFGGWVDPASR